MRGALPFATGLAGLCAVATAAHAQETFGAQPYAGGLLPNIGTTSRIGDLRPQLESLLKPQPPLSTNPAWVYQASMGADVGVTDNALRVSAPRKLDAFTLLTPSLVVNGDTARVKLNLSYAPTYRAYATTSSQNQLSQFGNATALATIVPDAVFIDLRGSITTQSLTGNTVNQGFSQNYNQQNEVQTTSFSITPYAEHRIGGWGTARVGYSLARTLQDTPNQNQNLQTNTVLGTPGYGAIGNLTTQRERASFASGENLGRFNLLTTLQAVQYSGGGTYSGAYRNEFDSELGFALTRQVTLLAGIGYQNIRYGGTPPTLINEPSYNFGVRYNPAPDSTITVLYGRRDGSASVSFDGSFAPTARTRIVGRYTTGLTTDIEQAQTVLETTTVGPTGLVSDTATGVPVAAGSGSGVQNGLYRVNRLSISAFLLQDRDSYSATLGAEDRTSVSSAPSALGNGVIPAGTTSNSINASVSWQHDLTPSVSGTTSLSYAMSNSTSQLLVGNTGQQRTVSLSAALTKQFTETLSGSLRYSFTDQNGGASSNTSFRNTTAANRGNGSFTENSVTVGLRKSF